MEIADILKLQLPFFREPELKEALANCTLADVPEGGVILKEGAYVKTIPILLSGLVKVIKQDEEKEILLYNIYPLESCIMSISCSLNQEKSKVKAIAEKDSQAILIPSQYMADWQRLYPSFNAYITNLFQKRFNNLLDAFDALAFQKLDQRIMAYFEAKVRNSGSDSIEMTHQEIADELGTYRETISRLLKKLESEGYLVLHRGRIQLVRD